MTNRQKSRLLTLIKIQTWKIKKDVNFIETNTISVDKMNELKDSLIQTVEDKFSKIMLSKTQLSYLSSETSQKRIEITLHQINKAILWEVATSSDIVSCLNDTSLSEADIIKIKTSAAKGLGIGSSQHSFDRESQIKYYRNEIVIALETTEEQIRYILDDIKKLCEYDSVLGAILNCNYVSSLPKRDRKKIYEEKMRFERIKQQTIENMKFLKLPYDDVEKKQYSTDEEYGWVNYEKTLKHIKKVLCDDLILICGTGKRRADAISKILEYI